MFCVVATSWMIRCSNNCGGDFLLSAPVPPAPGPNEPPVQWVLVLFPEGKAAGAGVDHLAASYTLGTAEPLLPLWSFKACHTETIIIHAINKMTGTL